VTQEDAGDRATLRAMGNGGSRPVPDPTELTDRAIRLLERQLTTLIDGEVKNLTTRINGAVALIDERFEAAEKLRIEQKKDTKDAVDAALSAAKEAVKEQTTASERSIDKSERATGEQLKQQQETFAKTAEGLADKIEDLKERVGRIESVKVGSTENRTTTFAVIGIVVSVGLALLTIVGFVIANLAK
jgi:formyltetrahydrofolate synthetase